MFTFEEFQKIDLRTAEIIKAEEIEGSDKLLKLQLKVGDEEKQILAGIKQAYSIEELRGKMIVIVNNLEPRELMGQQSCGMLLAADNDGVPVLLSIDKEVKSGSKIK